LSDLRIADFSTPCFSDDGIRYVFQGDLDAMIKMSLLDVKGPVHPESLNDQKTRHDHRSQDDDAP
jgi:hypothetical protein